LFRYCQGIVSGIFFQNRLVTSRVVAGMTLLLLTLVLQFVRLLRKPGDASHEAASAEKVKII
jgi:hypothetical protein